MLILERFYSKMRLDVSKDNIRAVFHVLGTQWDNPAAQLATFPLNLTAAAKANYFMVWLSLGNPSASAQLAT